MSEFPRTQKIAALALVTLVVIMTLIVLAARDDGNSSSADDSPPIDPNAEPTAIPVLERPRGTWDDIASIVRGAQGTSAPVDCPFVDERILETNNFLALTPSLTFVCTEAGQTATPIAPGRVVMRVTQAPLNSFKADLIANGNDGPWLRAGAYGPFVVIDHGPRDGVSNVTSIYAGLETIDPDLAVGQFVDTETMLGSLGARMINDELVNGVLSFELITDDTRFGSDPIRQSPPPASESPRLAALVEDSISLPVTTCTIPFGNVNLVVGAPREYRSGIHNGLDFNCGSTDHVIQSAAAGQVIFVVNDYVNASPEDREAVLAQTVPAFDTPFWTLANLYGNFVVIDHALIGGERAVTVYAHLSEVDSQILPGVLVDGGTPLGFVGNSGTSAASAGIENNDASVHLHWELHVNDRPIGYLESPTDTQPLYEQILCNPENPTTTVGC
ncbi:peptidoglycan DD-metalloendopeptidase family protein [Acidimicrobiales bacterium]|nr:peptidoglycan DD-metalloendopeptidase family protein [Acidimicrobiales bacterium]